MTDTTPDNSPDSQVALPTYHRQLLDYLRQHAAELWNWFDSHPVRARHADSVRLSLLRSTYRMDRESSPQLYSIADGVAEQMSVTVPVTLYQAQSSSGRNASLAWLPQEAHIVLQGDIQELLSDTELATVVAHELAHHELYTIDESAYLTVEQVLLAMGADRSARSAHMRTLCAFRLYTELYCDRRALEVTGELSDVLSALVRIDTGVQNISPDAYLRQAEEILAADPRESEEATHPEMYLRARALSAWNSDPETADAVMRPFIEGPFRLSQLDLLRQDRLSRFTERFLCEFLTPSWLRTRVTLGHMKRFFADFIWSDADAVMAGQCDVSIDDLQEDAQLQHYLCCLLLDFVTVDPELEDAPLAAAFLFADRQGLGELFEETAARELRTGKKHFRRVRDTADEIVADAEKEFTS